jgi:hypothetical protein
MKISDVTTLDKWGQLTRDKVLFPKVLAFAKSSHNMESVEFLTSMKSGAHNQLAYDKYIKRGAPKEVNLPGTMAVKFHTIAAEKPKPDWSKAPWGEATTEVLKLFRSNFKTVA